MLRLPGKLGFVVLLCGLALAAQSSPNKTVTHPHRKPAKTAETAKTPPPPAAIPEMWPEQLPPQAPRVSYQNGVLTVDSQNSTLRDILNAIRKQTGAQMEVPNGVGAERVAGHFSGTAHDVVQNLLQGSNLGYVILGSPTDPARIDKVILSTPGNLAGAMAPASSAPNAAPGGSFGRQAMNSRAPVAPPPPDPDSDDFAGSMPPDENAPTPDQAAPPADPAAAVPGPPGSGPPVSNVPKTGPPPPDQVPSDQNQVRSPEDYLRQLQEQRQRQMQQQQTTRQ